MAARSAGAPSVRRVAAAALPGTLRLLPWRALLLTGAGLVGFALLRRLADATPLLTIRVVTLVVAGAVAFGVGDQAATVTASSPSPLWSRRGARVLPLAVWAASTWWAAAYLTGDARVSTWGFAAHASVLVCISLATGLVAARRDESSAGPVGSAVVGLALAGALIAPTWWPLTSGGEAALATRDLLRGGGAAAVLIVIALSDPGRRFPWAAVRARRTIGQVPFGATRQR